MALAGQSPTARPQHPSVIRQPAKRCISIMQRHKKGACPKLPNALGLATCRDKMAWGAERARQKAGDLSESNISNNGKVAGFDTLDRRHLIAHAHLLFGFRWLVVYDRPEVLSGPELAKRLRHWRGRLVVSFCLLGLRGARVSGGNACCLRTAHACGSRGAPDVCHSAVGC